MRMTFKLFSENRNILKVLAFLLALILWFFVTGDRQELGLETRRSFDNIPLACRNLGQDLVIVEMNEEVTLSLQGLPQAFDGLTPADLEAYVELSGKREGRHELRINAVAPQGLSIVSIDPPRAIIILEDLVTRQMSVEDDLTGVPAGGLVVEEITFTPTEAFIKGPRRKIDLVSRVIFRLNIDGARENIIDSARLYTLDEQGSFIQGITISPENVDVQVTLTLPSKDLPVEAVFSSSDRSVETVIIEPSSVTVMGPQSLLDELESISTEEIDLEGRSSVFTEEVPLVLPEGLIVPENERVKVRVYLAD
jgi:YbbR domain-containing protein